MSEFEKILSKAVKPEFTNQRLGERLRLKDASLNKCTCTEKGDCHGREIVMCANVPYGYNDEILPIDFPLGSMIIEGHEDGVGFTVTQNKFKCDVFEKQECDMCLDWKPVINIHDSHDEGSYSTLICTDCLEKLIKIRKAL